MTPRDSLGGRLALWWIRVYTRTLPGPLRIDRRDELLADIHDHWSAGLATGTKPRRLSREIAMRVLKGAPADVLWRLEVEWDNDRLESLLSHPSTILTFLFALLLPVNLAWDALLDTGPALQAIVAGLRFVVWLLALLLVAYTGAVTLLWMTWGRAARVSGGWSELDWTRRVFRFSVPAMFFFYALSGLWRFSPDPMGQISAVAWGLFGITLLFNLVGFVGARLFKTRLTRKLLDLEKVPS